MQHFKMDRRRLKVERRRIVPWVATYPYPGLETVFGARNSMAAAGKTRAEAIANLQRQLDERSSL